MTYIVGFKQEKTHAIFADTRMTWSNSLAEGSSNHDLKSGILFDGCIFGSCGDGQESDNFVQAFHDSVKDRPFRDAEDIWQAFCAFANTYVFDSSSFEILLSVRHRGDELKFHLLRSHANVLTDRDFNTFYTLGSGRPLLDEELKDEMISEIDEMASSIESGIDAADGLGAATDERLRVNDNFNELIRCYCLAAPQRKDPGVGLWHLGGRWRWRIFSLHSSNANGGIVPRTNRIFLHV